MSDTKWKPGQTGNPGGRPKGIARLVRDVIGPRGMEEVIRAQHMIALGRHPLANELGEDAPMVQARECTGAAAWLRDTGFGRPQQSVDLTSGGEKLGGGAVTVDVSGLSEAELASIETIAAAAIESGDEPTKDDEEDPDGGAGPDDGAVH